MMVIRVTLRGQRNISEIDKFLHFNKIAKFLSERQIWDENRFPIFPLWFSGFKYLTNFEYLLFKSFWSTLGLNTKSIDFSLLKS